MAARKAGTKSVGQTARTSTTRGKTFQEVTADDPAPATDERPPVEDTSDHGPGYSGETPDPTPNENYTVAGVLADKPVPETDR